jgi:hypothetical protein
VTPHSASGAPSADTAGHLADLEARYDAHLAALRRHAEQLQTGIAHRADALADRAAPPPASSMLADAPLTIEPKLEPEPDPEREPTFNPT